MSTSRTMQRRSVRTSGRQGSVGRPHTRPSDTRSRATARSGGPEWATERWKLEVEAEARGRLKKNIRDIGSQQ